MRNLKYSPVATADPDGLAIEAVTKTARAGMSLRLRASKQKRVAEPDDGFAVMAR
jgi:hypothetical protein